MTTDSFIIIFSVSLLILTILMSVVGIYLIMVLIEARGTLKRVNSVIDEATSTVQKITATTGSLGGLMGGLATGVQVFKAFAGRLEEKRSTSRSKTKR